VLNNKNRKFGYWNTVDDILTHELNDIEFEKQYVEFILGKRELDKFLIRGMVNIDMLTFDISFREKCEKYGTKFILFSDKLVIDITKLDTSNITDMSGIFWGVKDFNQNINNWDVYQVTEMLGLFRYAETFNQSLDSWDVSNVGSHDGLFTMFDGAKSFKQYLGDRNIKGANLYVNGKRFDRHNEIYRFTEDRLLRYFNKYINDDSEKNKYELLKYCKQYYQENQSEFLNNIKNIPNIVNILIEIKISF
jgi:surface protein